MNFVENYIKQNLSEESYKSLCNFLNMVMDFSNGDKNEYIYYSKYLNKDNLFVPDTSIIPLDPSFIKYLYMDNFDDEIDKKISEYFLEKLKSQDFDLNRDLFVKTGKFSDKFNFDNPYVKKEDVSNIGKHIINVCYSSICLHDFISPYILVREFIHTNYSRPTIYNGLKLNTEFRVFYDFDNKQIMDIINYWDYDTMESNLKTTSMEDYNSFLNVGKIIENDFNSLKSSLHDLVTNTFCEINLDGKWSVDFLWDGNNFRLIDMAIAEQSYYYDKILTK